MFTVLLHCLFVLVLAPQFEVVQTSLFNTCRWNFVHCSDQSLLHTRVYCIPIPKANNVFSKRIEITVAPTL